jgi:transposase
MEGGETLMPKTTKYARRYSPRLKFQVVLEALKGGSETGQIAKAYGVHPTSIHYWKKEFLAKGPEMFARKNLVSEHEAKIAKLERIIGQKEIENALLKNFLGREA